MAGIAKQLTSSLAAALIAAGCALADDADTLRTTVEQANTLLSQGKADDALAMYSKSLEQAGAAAPAELVYDNACALLAAGKLPEAEAGFRTIAARESSPLAASAAYNLGLIEAKRAEDSAQKSPQDAIDALKRAERQFRTALAGTPNDDAAAKNIDLVQRRIAALQKKQEEHKKQDEQKKQQQQQQKDSKQGESRKSDQQNGEQSQQSNQDKQQGDQNLSDDLNKLAQQEDQQSKDSHDLNDKSQQGKSKEDMAKDQQQAAQKQEDLRKKTDEAKKKTESQSSKAQSQQEKDSMNKAKENLDKAEEAQKQAEEKLKNGDSKSAEQLQKDAADKLRQAAQQARKGEDAQKQQEQQQQQEAQAQQQEQGEKQGDKPFDATAAQILDQEKKIKEALARMQRQRSKPAPVAKDW
jgi:hypothetical protein